MAGLRARGWTDALIRTFVPDHDKEVPNPHHRSGPKMRLYLLGRVEEIERSEGFIVAKQIVEPRKVGAAKAVATKKAVLLREVSGWVIVVGKQENLLRNAITSYNEFNGEIAFERCHDFTPASESGDKEFLHRILVNYIRHNLSDYDERIERMFGKVGKQEAYEILNRKIYAAIAVTYPDLVEECERQLSRKLEVC
jgi:hypothetical protein